MSPNYFRTSSLTPITSGTTYTPTDTTGTVYNFLTSYHCNVKVAAVIIWDAGMTAVSVNAASWNRYSKDVQHIHSLFRSTSHNHPQIRTPSWRMPTIYTVNKTAKSMAKTAANILNVIKQDPSEKLTVHHCPEIPRFIQKPKFQFSHLTTTCPYP